MRVLVYGLSYAYHAVNLAAFVFRRTEAARFALQSAACRTLAFGLLAAVAVRSGELAPFVGGWSMLVAGIVLNALAVRVLGVTRTYYGAELGAVPHARVGSFPTRGFPTRCTRASCCSSRRSACCAPRSRVSSRCSCRGTSR